MFRKLSFSIKKKTLIPLFIYIFIRVSEIDYSSEISAYKFL